MSFFKRLADNIKGNEDFNGVSVRSEWNVPVEQLTDISFTLFLMVKLKKAEVEFLDKKLTRVLKVCSRLFAIL